VPLGELPASPPDITAILTSLGVFSLAIAAVVGGIYKGIKEVKKEGGSAAEGKSSLVFDSSLVRQLLESNNQLTDVNREIASILRAIQHRLDHSVEATQDHRNIVRSQIEEQHRLRAAIVDLIELLRRR